ncbi:hypothetical protein FIBSPDRAFT_869411 [Athelia psychrophila]|uniref:Mid2 domain-containing protein n=1 Tax=Athelia psychrophila TaxID=1759441 RepID=A0A166C475_9AGAM|nr:hypothetical protein FIBSPDRAFT_869411 [Fibularhizoctonia sp. CBS 109695]
MLSRIAVVCALALLATLSSAIVVTEPNSVTLWTSTGPNQIAWRNQTGDPSTISLRVIPHNVSTYTPSQAFPADGVFASGVAIDAHIYVFTPACLDGVSDTGARLPTGSGFKVQFINTGGTGNGTVIATSNMFRIEPADSATACDTGGLTSVEGSPTAMSAIAGSTGSGASGSLSASAHSNTAAIVGGTIAGVLALLIIAGVGVWLRKRRRDTRRETIAYSLRLQDRMHLTAGGGKARQAEQGVA